MHRYLLTPLQPPSAFVAAAQFVSHQHCEEGGREEGEEEEERMMMEGYISADHFT